MFFSGSLPAIIFCILMKFGAGIFILILMVWIHHNSSKNLALSNYLLLYSGVLFSRMVRVMAYNTMLL